MHRCCNRGAVIIADINRLVKNYFLTDILTQFTARPILEIGETHVCLRARAYEKQSEQKGMK